MNRYSAKLLFGFRVLVEDPGTKLLCEERIISYVADNSKLALGVAKRKGKESEYEYLNDEGQTVQFEFIGVLDLLHLDVECDEEEVWYDIVERDIAVTAPAEESLTALRDDHPPSNPPRP